MTFKLTIAMDNAAFEDDAGYELARILAELADNIDGDLRGTVRDINGNTVGKWEVTE